jgi:hypothetical protein
MKYTMKYTVSRRATFAGAAFVLLGAVVTGCAQPPPEPAKPPLPPPPPPKVAAITLPPEPPMAGETLAQVLMPGNKPVGRPKPDQDVRLLLGGEPAATKLFERLTAGARDVTPKNFPGIVRKLHDGTTITYRFPDAHGGAPTILLKAAGVPFHRIEFLPGLSKDGGGD